MQRNALDTRPQPNPDSRNGGGGILILADDLTGACDSGVAFLSAGRVVRVVLGRTGFDLSPATHGGAEAVVALTTETRNLTQEQATKRLAETLTPVLKARSGHLLFKKVDSAARGHFGAETVAALDAWGAALALVAPAFPQAGRTVSDGVLEVRDTAGQRAMVPLRGLFPEVDAAHIEVLASGNESAMEAGIARALDKGIRVLLCDSGTQADLERLARVAYRQAGQLLWTGSAGLAHALAAVVPASGSMEPIRPTRRGGCPLLFVGTEHPVTTLQVTHLERHCDGQDLAIHRVQWSDESSIPSSAEVRAAFAASSASALILTGGDTAAFVLGALGASSILLGGEVLRGIPWGVVEGGDADGCMAVTKSGGFGGRGALADVLEFCRESCDRRDCAPA